jgi:hypothetical protein
MIIFLSKPNPGRSAVRSLELLIKLCSPGRDLELHTTSDFSLEQWNIMKHDWEEGYKNFWWDEAPYHWQQVLSELQDKDKRLRMFKKTDEEEPQLTQVARLYCEPGNQ